MGDGGFLEQVHDSLRVVLEAAGMPQAREDLIIAWKRFKNKKDGLRYTNDNEEFQNCEVQPTRTSSGSCVRCA